METAVKSNLTSIVYHLENPEPTVSLWIPLTPKSDQHLISPYNNTAEFFIYIMRIKEMIVNPKSFDCYMYSPCKHQRICIEKIMEKMDTDVFI